MSLPRPRADAHPAVDFRWRARAKEFAPRKKALLGESLPTRRTGERICPREKALLRESIPTRRTSEGICPAQEHAPRRRPPDTAHGRKNLPRAGALPTAKASRHGARAKGFVPRRNAPLGEGLSTRRTSERIGPAQEHAPRRRPPDTAHGRKDLPRGVRVRPTCRRTAGRSRPTNSRKNTPSAGSHPTRRASERICPAGFALAPRADERRAALDRRTAEKHPFGGVAPERARPLPSSFTEKK